MKNRDYWFLCKPIFMKFMFAKFKDEIIEFLITKDIKDEDDDRNYSLVVFISKYNRLDLCEIVYSKTDSFNEIVRSLKLAAEFGNLKVAKYLSKLNVSCADDAMDYASKNGHLDVVQWLHLNRSEGCSKDAINLTAMDI